MNLTEKTAYLKGLIEGMDLNKDDKCTRIFKEIVGILEDMAISVCDLDDEVETLNGIVDEIDEDLGEIEEFVYGDDDKDDDFNEDDYDEVECPECGTLVYIDDDCDLDDLECPECKKRFKYDFKCDCGCDHGEPK